MTPWADLADRLVDAMDVRWAGYGGIGDATLVRAGLRVMRRSRTDRWQVWTSQVSAGTSVDSATLIVALLLHEVAVDVGWCPKCCGNARLPTTRDGWEQDEDDEWRPCPACTIDGKPTGREVVDGARLVLDAAPQERKTAEFRTRAEARKWCAAQGWPSTLVCCDYEAEPWPWAISTYARGGGPLACWSEMRAPQGADASKCRPRVRTGDPKAGETLDVLGDRLQAEGDERGDVLAAWLRRECSTCKGSGTCEMEALTTGGPPWRWECPPCHGHGTILGAHADLVERLVVEVCERLELARLRLIGAQYTRE